MGHAGNPDKFFEILCNELRAVVGDDPGSGCRVFLFRSFKNDFYILLGHLLPDLPVDDGAAAPIKKAAKVVESTTDVDV